MFSSVSGIPGYQASQVYGSRDNKAFSIARPNRCELCGKVFPDSYKLRRHYRVHTGEKAYSCHVCGKKFTQKENMKVHMIVHINRK